MREMKIFVSSANHLKSSELKMTIKHKVVSCTMCEKEFWVNKNIMQGLMTAIDEHLCLECGKVVGGLK